MGEQDRDCPHTYDYDLHTVSISHFTDVAADGSTMLLHNTPSLRFMFVFPLGVAQCIVLDECMTHTH